MQLDGNQSVILTLTEFNELMLQIKDRSDMVDNLHKLIKDQDREIDALRQDIHGLNLRGIRTYKQLITDRISCDTVDRIIGEKVDLHGRHTPQHGKSWKIEAIKEVRNRFMVGLKEAKDWTESQAVKLGYLVPNTDGILVEP